jgi:hypothetical protein
MAIGVDQITLSMTSPDSGEYLMANIYTIDGVYEADGVTPRQLSIGQVIMALCLQRAAQLEGDIIRKMNSIEDVSEQLELMTQIENEVLEGTVNMSTSTLTYKGVTYSYYDFLSSIAEVDNVPSGDCDRTNEDFITSLEAKMDSNNSYSQQTMIELQSQTNKRDQCYDMISNSLKSLNTVLIGTVNNM